MTVESNPVDEKPMSFAGTPIDAQTLAKAGPVDWMNYPFTASQALVIDDTPQTVAVVRYEVAVHPDLPEEEADRIARVVGLAVKNALFPADSTEAEASDPINA